jgi:hypothetical protein
MFILLRKFHIKNKYEYILKSLLFTSAEILSKVIHEYILKSLLFTSAEIL